MKVIPAIDIIDGKAVRLFQGDYNKTDFIGQDVLELAKSFVDSGADLIHLVDLDGAKAGKLVNKETILEVVKTLKVDVEVGGGIRNYDDIKALIDGGVARVILGTVAIENRDLLVKVVKDFGDKIAVAVDFKDGYICTKGWIDKSEATKIDVTASGGVKDINDIIALKALDVYGCIVGKAIYSKTIDIKEAINLCK